MSDVDSVIQDPDRLAAVRALGLLDSALHAPLDEFARIAAESLQVPVAAVSLLDADHQHFVAVHGLPVDPARPRRRISMGGSICRYTVAAGEPQRIPDLREDDRFCEPITLGGLEVVSYLGVPLRVHGDAVVGSLCVVDGHPREWSEPEVTVLSELAVSVAGFLALRLRVLDRTLHDSLTGLPGATLFLARCESSRRRRSPGRSAMYRIEVPGLRPSVRTPEASPTDDRAVAEAARRLGETAPASTVLGRLPDGAFVLFAHELTDERDALRLAARLRGALRGETGADAADPVRIGIALADAAEEPTSELVRRAEHVIRGAASSGSVTEIARAA